jgi:hypothetical protein
VKILFLLSSVVADLAFSFPSSVGALLAVVALGNKGSEAETGKAKRCHHVPIVLPRYSYYEYLCVYLSELVCSSMNSNISLTYTFLNSSNYLIPIYIINVESSDILMMIGRNVTTQDQSQERHDEI